MTRSQTLGMLFSTVKAEVVTKLVKLGILFSISFILALKVVSVAKLEIPDILSSLFSMLPLYISF